MGYIQNEEFVVFLVAVVVADVTEADVVVARYSAGSVR
jgi:hypothetical protein